MNSTAICPDRTTHENSPGPQQQFIEALLDPWTVSLKLPSLNALGRTDAERDRAVNDLYRLVPPEVADKLLIAKWQTPDRTRAIHAFMEQRSNHVDFSDYQVVKVTDLSTARSQEAGRFVHRIMLLSTEGETTTLFIKGHGAAESSPLLSFPGWENRPNVHLYESFFWKMAAEAGLSQRSSRFFAENTDAACIGYTITEEIPGENSDLLVKAPSSAAALGSELTPFLPSLISQFAKWCALNEIVRGGDRRVLNLTEGYHRPSNFLVAFFATGPLVTGIDHELLFCKEPCISYDREHRAHELNLLSIVPGEIRPIASRAFVRSFVQTWNEFTAPNVANSFRALIAQNFGAMSEEMKVFEASIKQDPRAVVRELLATIEAAPSRLPEEFSTKQEK